MSSIFYGSIPKIFVLYIRGIIGVIFILNYFTYSMEQSPEKLTDSQLLKKLSAFYRTQNFIPAFTCPYPEPHIPLPEDPS
jgi:hypothetical protein